MNLSKHSGVIRLIIKPNSDNEIELFCYNHYEDFNPEKVIYYE